MQSQVFPGAAMRHVPAEAAVPATDLAQPGMRVGTVTDAGPGHRAWGSSGIPALKRGGPSRGKVPLGQSSQVLVGKLNRACGPCVEAPTCVCV